MFVEIIRFSKVLSGRKSSVLRHNLYFFRKMDAIVAPERNFLNHRTKYHIEKLLMIHRRHGAGDRAGGFDEV